MTPAKPPGFDVERLSSDHDRKSFDCGVEALDRYLRDQAGQDVRRRLAAVFVLVEETGRRVAGYYALSALSIRADDLPGEHFRKLPRDRPIPVTLLGRLAIARSHRGSGLGAALLMDATRRALEHSAEIGALAVVVDAIDEAAARFYAKHGFIAFPERPLRLFIPMATIERLG